MYRLKKVFQIGWSLLLDTLSAPTCWQCQTATEHPHQLCPECQQLLPKQPETHCLRCGNWTNTVQAGCGYCLNDLERTADATYFAYRYEGCIREWILSLKFSDRTEWSTLLGLLFWQRLQDDLRWESPDMVIPMPLHPRRLIARRFNQSALLASSLAAFLRRPMVTNGLKRIKMTQQQSRLHPQKRLENVSGAFRAVERRVQGRSVLLVDDVFTTGATSRAAVRALKIAGAGRVVMTCLAAAQPDHSIIKDTTEQNDST